ncbi:MAG: phosphatidylinositol phosphate synthase [Sciscionella sp.]
MLNIFARASISRVTDPIGARLVAVGITPNAMTVIGTVLSLAAILFFLPQDHLFWGTVAIAVFISFDLVDGAMARSAGRSTPFGAVLDASCDRLVDGALFAAIAWWCLVVARDEPAGAAALACGALAQVISYIKARAEASGLVADGGLVERAERFILALVGTGLQGLGVPHAVDVAIWLLLLASLITVVQRILAVRRSASAERRERGGLRE